MVLIQVSNVNTLTALDCGKDILVTGTASDTPNYTTFRKEHNGDIKIWDVYKAKSSRV